MGDASMTPAQMADRANREMSERQLEEWVRATARLTGWRRYHTQRSERSPAGFPDDVLVRGDTLLLVELKRQLGSRLTPDQRAWMADLAQVRTVVLDVWRPSDRDRALQLLQDGVGPRADGGPVIIASGYARELGPR